MSWILKKEEIEAGIEIEKDQFSFRKQYIEKSWGKKDVSFK